MSRKELVQVSRVDRSGKPGQRKKKKKHHENNAKSILGLIAFLAFAEAAHAAHVFITAQTPEEMISDFESKLYEIMGLFARKHLYMAAKYPPPKRFKMGSRTEKLVKAWDKQYPVTKEECDLDKKISKAQGWSNHFLSEKYANLSSK